MESLLRIDGEHLATTVGESESNMCLDTESGRLLSKSACPDDETGYGRPAVKDGKRYIIIPSLDELVQEGVWQGHQMEKRAEQEAQEEVRLDSDPAYREFSNTCIEMNAMEMIARNWLATLQLPSRIAWIDTALGGINGNILMVYDSTEGEWEAIS